METTASEKSAIASSSATAIGALNASPLIPLAVGPCTKHSNESGWTSLPDDIVADILLRLPIKPLFKFKCISKHYESIISNRTFAERYHQRVRFSWDAPSSSGLKTVLLYPFSKQDPHGFSKNARYLPDSLGQANNDDNDEPISICYFNPIPRKEPEILASSNGLLLCRLTRLESTSHYNQLTRFTLRVSNPLTKQWVRVPDPRRLTDAKELVFGFAARSSGYKIVLFRCVCAKLLRANEHIKVRVETFCSLSGLWERRNVSRCPVELITKKGVVQLQTMLSHKGVLFWLSESEIITYDPFTLPYRFGSIPLFERKYKHSSRGNLVYSGDEDMLRGCELVEGERGVGRVVVWGLVDDKSEWCVLGEYCYPPRTYLHCIPLMVALNPRDPDVVCDPCVNGCKVMVFDLRTGAGKPVEVLDPRNEPERYRWHSSYSKPPFIRVELCPWSSPSYHKHVPKNLRRLLPGCSTG